MSIYKPNSRGVIMKASKQNESGIAHIGLILLAVAVIGVGSLVYWRVSNTKSKTQANVAETNRQEQITPLPDNLQGLKTQEEIKQIAGTSTGVDVVSLVLESKDGSFVYKIVLSNGKKLVIDAQSGKVLSQETTDVAESDKIPAGVQVKISSDQAYKIAASKHSSPIKTIEMETEDKKVVYKIEYKDGSKIEIDATTGAVLKSEFKDEQDNQDQEDTENNDQENENEER